MNEYTMSQIFIGMTEKKKKEITMEMERSFRIISGDNNPLHQDDEFAREVGKGQFPSHVTFGMLTASLYSTMAGLYLPGKYSLIHSFDEVAFLKPVFVGDVLTVTGKVTDKDENLGLMKIKVIIKNQENMKVSRAKMKVLVLK